MPSSSSSSAWDSNHGYIARTRGSATLHRLGDLPRTGNCLNMKTRLKVAGNVELLRKDATPSPAPERVTLQ
ncbi:hypothetical protein THAOC_24566, partial [Thalassiosira oceanica]